MIDRKDFEELLNSARLEDCFPDVDELKTMMEISGGSTVQLIACVARYGFLMGQAA